MRRRTVLSGLTAFAGVGYSLTAQGQRRRRVGVVTTERHLYEAVVEGLRELGWDTEREIEVVHSATGSLEDIDRLLELKPEAIVLGGAVRIAYAAQRSLQTPIIAIDLEDDPERSGFIQSLARPGGNVTGLWLDMPEMAGKLVELLKAVVPDLSRCAILWDQRFGRTQIEATERAAGDANIAVERLVFHDLQDPEPLIAGTTADGLIVLTSPTIFVQREKIAVAARARRLASISIFPDYARAGGLMGYGPSLIGMFRRSGRYVDAVLRGRAPAELPVERPTRFEFVLNQRTADALGLRFPLSLLAGADEVIE